MRKFGAFELLSVVSSLALLGLSACMTPRPQVQAPLPEEKKLLYKDLMIELAQEISRVLPPEARVAVLKFPSHTGQETNFSSNVAMKLEMGFIKAGRDIVDRAKIDQILKEQHFQQGDAALFDATKSARIGKFAGANVVIGGEYLVILPKKVLVTARAISVETTRVLTIQEKEIPLTDAGADNWDTLVELLRSPSQ